MKCDLCNRKHDTRDLLCENCADMVRRLVVVHERMQIEEVAAAKRLANTQAAAAAAGAASQ